MDSSTLTVLVLLATVLLRAGLVAGVVWALIPGRRVCPHCRDETAGLVTPRVLRTLLLERRWCPGCGWKGVCRHRPASPRTARRPAPAAPLALLLVLPWLGCAPGDGVRELFESPTAWVDLTYPFDDQTIYWPTAERFALEVVAAGMTPAGYYYAANNFRGAEHGGTHLDAPLHFAERGRSTDQIPLAQLVGPAVVVDVSVQAASDPDYRMSVADVQAFEAAYDRIPDGAILLVRTGWGRRWPDATAYLGTDRRGADAVPTLRFPGIDPAAARWLVAERAVDAVGIDTPSIDHGPSQTFEVHQILFAANIPAFENVANLDRLPESGAYVVALPMKIQGGSGGPLRIVGVVPPR